MRTDKDISFLEQKKIGKYDIDTLLWYVALSFSCIALAALLFTDSKILNIPDSVLTLVSIITIIVSYFSIKDRHEKLIKTVGFFTLGILALYPYINSDFIEDIRNKVNNSSLTYSYNPIVVQPDVLKAVQPSASLDEKQTIDVLAKEQGLKPIEALTPENLKWCNEDDDKDSVINAKEYNQAFLHCSTGWKWTKKDGWSDVKLNN